MMQDPVKTIDSLKEIDFDSFCSDGDRVLATEVVRGLLSRLERPTDQVLRMTWMDPSYMAALKIAVDTKLFKKWVAAHSSPMTAAELSGLCGIEESLLTRLLRHMVAMGGLEQPEVGTYALTPFTTSLVVNKFSDNINMMFSQMYPGFLNLPSFLSELEYKEGTDPTKSNWQDLLQRPETYIQWIGSDPARIQQFHNVMLPYNSATPTWVDRYPTKKLVDDMKSERVLLVDIGASKGVDLVAFLRKHPKLPPGSLILQDLPHIIDTLKAPDGITTMVQDVFEPQKIKGARAYFMRFLLHGSNDEQSLKALKNIAAVMDPGYSKILLNEHVINEERPSPTATSMDLTMTVKLSASKRTKTQWTNLVESAGLKVTEIYAALDVNESIIEAEIA